MHVIANVGVVMIAVINIARAKLVPKRYRIASPPTLALGVTPFDSHKALLAKSTHLILAFGYEHDLRPIPMQSKK